LLVEKEAKLQEIISSTNSTINQNVKSHENTKSTKLQTHKSFVTHTSQQDSAQFCKFCNHSTHSTYNCPKFIEKSCNDRYSMVKEAKLCFNCLKGHNINMCRSNYACKICKRKHNTLLHRTDDKSISDTSAKCSVSQKSSFLPVVSLPLQTSNGVQFFGALLDTGSDRSFIRKDILNSLSHKIITHTNLRIQGFNQDTVTERCPIVEVTLMHKRFDQLTLQLCVSTNMAQMQYSSFKDAEKLLNNMNYFSSVQPEKVDIIIGADNYYRIATGNSLLLDDNVRVIETHFGNTLHGASSSTTCFSDKANVHFTSSEIVQDSFDTRKYWNNELAGILPPEAEASAFDIDSFSNQLNFKDNRYSTALPWIPGNCITSTFKEQALQRLRAVIKKLVKTNMLISYDNIFREYLDSGIIEPCEEETSSCRYIPHHPVIKHTENKIRIVFDASSKPDGENSINDCLSEGDNLFPSIFGILTRFRLHQFALSADIQKAFLQIGVEQEDRDYMRFFWYDCVEQNFAAFGREKSFRFCRVPFGFRSSPFLLNIIIKHHLETVKSEFSAATSILKDNIYVDDIVVSMSRTEDLSQFVDDSTEIFNRMSMNLHKWKTNTTLPNIESTESTETILGVKWNPAKDILSIKIPESSVINTKRSLASYLCSIFDPLGFLLPFSNQFKMLLQQCWLIKASWDEALPENICKEISKLLHDAKILQSFSVSRWLGFSEGCTNVHLCVFGDASTSCYSTCAYIYFDIENETRSSFLCAKSRIASKKQHTVPRLELLAALITARLANSIESIFPHDFFSRVMCFSDSQVVLGWIRNKTKTYKPFIMNRLLEIRRLSDTESWHYVPSESNPADLATRKVSVRCWFKNNLWWKGPDVKKVLSATAPATKDDQQEVTQMQTTTSKLVQLMDFNRFSNYRRLLNTMMYVLKFVNYQWSSNKLQDSENKVIQLVQAECFSEEINRLSQNAPINRSSKLSTLQPFMDEKGILRSKGRLQDSEQSYSIKHPIILPKNHYVTQLLVRHYHDTNIHAGVSTLVTILRQKYWILQCRRVCKTIIHNCITCKKQRLTHCSEEFAPLPPERVRQFSLHPFEFTGLDYLGPIVTLNNHKKLYILLLTCMQTRAIHLECTTSLNLTDLCNALTRFFSRRGVPPQLRSDNAKTFKAASLQLSSPRLLWVFNIEAAPWTGGCWERLVRSVKTCLRTSLLNFKKDYPDIEALVCYCEYVINSRPLTYSTGNDESVLPLCPNNFTHPCYHADTDCNSNQTHHTIIKSMQCNRNIIHNFWKRWQREYITYLNKNPSAKRGPEIKIGDIMVLNEGPIKTTRSLVKVVDLIYSRDNKVRAVKILHNRKIKQRPIKLLHSLELPMLEVASPAGNVTD